MRRSRLARLGLRLLALSVLWVARPASAQPLSTYTSNEALVLANVGLKVSVAPGLFIPRDGSAGFSLLGDLRYGIQTGPLVLAPGVRLAGYFSNRTALTALGMLRGTLPLGPFGPFLLGGVGPGWVSQPSSASFTYLLGGGLMFQATPRIAIGGEIHYQSLTGTRFRSWFFGPSLLISLF